MTDPDARPLADGGTEGAAVVDAVFDAVAATAPEIRAALPGRRAESGTENASGESVLAGDLYADELLGEAVTAVDGVGAFVSEEREAVVDAGGAVGDGDPGEPPFAVAVDPLDGSSNLRSNNAMGTVVGVYDAPPPARGRDLVAAGYVLYGPITTMVVADGAGVREEVVERAPDGDGVERSVVEPDLTLPAQPTVYGFGGRVPDWPSDFRAFARAVEDDLKLRYGGAMVGDVNQVLTYGGVFAYPALRSAPAGKLRLQFEANPIAYLVERAGGASSDGTGSILDVEPEGVHQRTPLYVGNESLIERLEAALGGD
jgi:fructose-1,6-bisphosphatase I